MIDIAENKEKSKGFISRIHRNLKIYFNKENISVFSLGDSNELFNRHEFLFNIHVCKINKFNPNLHSENMTHCIEESLLQIES